MTLRSSIMGRSSKMQALLDRPIFPYLALAFGIVGLSFGGVFIRLTGAPGPVVGTYRFGLATLFLLPPLMRYRLEPILPYNNRSIGLMIVPILGGLFTAVDYGAWSIALAYTSVGNATLLNYTAPLWVGLVAALVFKEKLGRYFWPGLLLAIFGAALVVGGDYSAGISMAKGDLLALFSGFFYAGYFVTTQIGRSRLSTLTYISISSVSSAVSLLGICWLLNFPLTGYALQTYLLFVIATVVSLSGKFALNFSLGHISAAVVSPTMMLQPILASVLALWFLGEQFSIFQVVGGIVALIGISIVHLGKPQSPVADDVQS